MWMVLIAAGFSCARGVGCGGCFVNALAILVLGASMLVVVKVGVRGAQGCCGR